MLSNLKENHRYVFYKQRPGSDTITKFRAVVISIRDGNLLVHSYESDTQLYYNYSKHCIWSMPVNWIKMVEVENEDIAIDHEEICINYTEDIIEIK